ncbi:hypothetical protein FJTKL_05703 [Diaporthe vaccinii]|uniref:Uncharacterized protein n=1 Tax=Diaporthe vaccinii TaxID=105482 RepID=A0ABR4DRD0_9PEZI
MNLAVEVQEKHSEGCETRVFSEVIDPTRSRAGNGVAGSEWPLQAMGAFDTAEPVNTCPGNQKGEGTIRRETGRNTRPNQSGHHHLGFVRLIFICIVSHRVMEVSTRQVLQEFLTAAIFLSDQLRQSRLEIIPQTSRAYFLHMREPITSSRRPHHGWQPMPDLWCLLG